jgi:hypothetical protein
MYSSESPHNRQENITSGLSILSILGSIATLLLVGSMLWYFSCAQTFGQFLRQGYGSCNPNALSAEQDNVFQKDGILLSPDGYLAYLSNALVELRQLDTDKDGILDIIDTDDDNDGILDTVDTDDNGNGINDNIDGVTILMGLLDSVDTSGTSPTFLASPGDPAPRVTPVTPVTQSIIYPSENITSSADVLQFADLQDVSRRSDAITFLGNPKNSVLSGFAIGIDESELDIAKLKGKITSKQLAGGSLNLASQVTGTLPVGSGGTGITTIGLAGSLAYSTGSAYDFGAVGTTGQAVLSGGTGAPTFFAPTAGSIIFAGTSGILQQDNANFFWDDTNNRLGIGTNSPAYPLEVIGTNIRLTSSGAGAIGLTAPTNPYLFAQDTTNNVTVKAQAFDTLGYVGTETAHDLSLITGNIPRLNIINSNGNVGIGDAAPTARLSVAGTNTTTGASYASISGTLASSVTSIQNGLLVSPTFTPTGASINAIRGMSKAATLGTSSLNVNTLTGSFARIQTTAGYTGTVASGYTYFAEVPSVVGTNAITNVYQYYANSIANGNGITSGTVTNTGFHVVGGASAAGVGGTVINYGLHSATPFGSGAGTTINYGIRISGAGGSGGAGSTTNWGVYVDTVNAYFGGLIGVGTSSPLAKVNIAGNQSIASWTATGPNLAVNANTLTDATSAAAATITTRAANSFGTPTLASTNAITVTNAATLYIAAAPTAGTNTTITNSYAVYSAAGNNYFGGGVSIGTTSSSAQLHTTGSVRFATFGAGTLQTDASGNLSVSSDERLKRVQGTFNRGLSALQNIEPIAYKWRSNSNQETEGTYYGFSAQNIQENIPEAIGEDSRGYLTLSDRPILATVINATKELSGTVNQNTEGLTSLNSQLLGYNESAVDLSGKITEVADEITNLKDEVDALREELTQNNAGAGINIEGIFANGITVSGVALFNGIANFVDGVIFDKLAQFKDGVVFEGLVTFSSDTAGKATIESGKKKVEVTFENAYDTAPVVTVTPKDFIAEGSYRVTDETVNGFTIEIDPEQDEDIDFAWTAVQIAE